MGEEEEEEEEEEVEEARLAAEEEKKRENEIGEEGKEKEQMRANYLCVVYHNSVLMQAPLITPCARTWLAEDLWVN